MQFAETLTTFISGGQLPLLKIGPYSVPTYFVVISLTFCFCIKFLVTRAEKLRFGRNQVLDLALAAMLGGFVGARLLHVLFEAPAHYKEHPLEILHVWQGGFVYFGGMLAGWAAGFTTLRLRSGEAAGPYLDLFAPVLAAGYSLGRLACWLTGCCFGSLCMIPGLMSFQHPTQLYAVAWEAGVTWFLLWFEKKKKRAPVILWRAGSMFWLWLVLHGIGRMLMETFRADDRGPETLGMSLSFWLAAGVLVTGAVMLTRARIFVRRRR